MLFIISLNEDVELLIGSLAPAVPKLPPKLTGTKSIAKDLARNTSYQFYWNVDGAGKLVKDLSKMLSNSYA